jgi:ribosomal protein S18 acetylase RimI-like enzyme
MLSLFYRELEKEKMSNCIIRKAKETDFANLLDLSLLLTDKEFKEYDKTLKPEWLSEEEGRQYLNEHISQENKCALIAEFNGKLIGYLLGEITPKDEYVYRKINSYAELSELFVLDEHRNKGTGSFLMNAFVNWCKEKSVEKIKVEVMKQNYSGINFYNKNGFDEYCVSLEMDLTAQKENSTLAQTDCTIKA